MILYTWQFSRLSVLLVDSPLLRQGGFLLAPLVAVLN